MNLGLVGDYQLALCPHSALAEEIKAARIHFFSVYKLDQQLPDHLYFSLASFQIFLSEQQKICQSFTRLAAEVRPFTIHLDGFGSAPTHTIFFNVTTRLTLRGLVSLLKQLQSFLKVSKENKPHFFDNPMLVLANKLKPWQFEKGWMHYQHLPFSGRFIADRLLLLKRTDGSTSWSKIHSFDFLSQPSQKEQGILFT